MDVHLRKNNESSIVQDNEMRQRVQGWFHLKLFKIIHFAANIASSVCVDD